MREPLVVCTISHADRVDVRISNGRQEVVFLCGLGCIMHHYHVVV